MRRPGRILGAIAVLVASAACSVGPEEGAHVIPGEEVPYGLLAEERPDATATVPDGTAVALYLVQDEQLVEVRRELPPDAEPVDLVRMLAAPPTEAEASAGLATSVPDPEVYREVDVVRGTAEVDLDPSFSELDAEAQALAIAQTVFTLTARPGIGRVRFSLDGASAEVPRGDGTLTGEPLARDDFPALLAGSG